MRKFALLILATFVTAAAMAQVTTSSMSGNVTDNNGNPLIGATVIAVHTPSGTQYGSAVDANGNYRILNMRPGGPYTIAVQMLGYNTTEYTGINLDLADNYVLDARLSEAALGMEEIVVRGVGRDNMNTDRAGAITTINSNKMAMQPTVSRNLNDIIKLSPQALTTSNGLAVGGGNYRQSYITVDGAAFNNAFGIGQNLPAGGSPISMDALEQISVSVTPYDVRQSGFTGGAINAVTKSGDNEFRGSAYWYYNNEKWKGNDTKVGEFNKSEQQYNLYGVSVGGPIVKNKLFFFANVEIERETSPGPTYQARPSTSTELSSTGIYKYPTVSEMDAVRNHLINNYGYDPGPYQGYSNKTPAHKILARVDWNINDNHKLNVRYSTTASKYKANMSGSASPFSSPSIMYPFSRRRDNSDDYAMYTFQNSQYWQEQNFHSFAAELNSQFGRFSNTFRVTYSHQDEPRSWDGALFPTVDILRQDENGDYHTFISFGTDPYTYGNLREVKTVVVTDELNWSVNKHNLTAGIQYEFDRTKNGYMPQANGWYVFASWDDFVNGNDAISFTIMHPNNSALKQTYPSFDYEQFSVYFQDKVDVSNNFKFTYGLRVELPTFPALEDNFNPHFDQMYFGNRKFSTDDMPKARIQLSPRVGFNWDIKGDRSMVLRGGSGIFTGRIPFVWIVAAVGNSEVSQTRYTAQYGSGDYVPAFHTDINDMLNDVYNGAFQSGLAGVPTTPTIMDKNLKMPSTWKTSLGYDVRLPGGILGTVEGIFNQDVNSVVINNAGLKDPGSTLTVSANDVRPYYGTGTDRYYNTTGSTAITPYYITNSDKNGWYYSITASLEKNFRNGLSLMAAYTHANNRALSDGIGDASSSGWNTNTNTVTGTNDHQLSYGSYVSPHRFIASIGYQKAYAKHFKTSVALFYEGYNYGYAGGYSYTRYSYTYTAPIVGDGGANNLLYIPKDWDELNAMTFSDYTYKVDGKDVTYTAAQQKEDYWAFINQDKYLKKHKGEYTKRNGAVMPWRSRFDFKVMQDFSVRTAGGKRNTLQVGLDIYNVANLLNKNWGNIKTVTNNTPLLAEVDSTNGVVTSFQFQRNGSEKLDKTFSRMATYNSTYSMQISLRYIFN
ncbi:MAG: TonB-dependent receptor [Alistipes sp.]|nr:TonB-dependent receptor [Alistipes sp.]